MLQQGRERHPETWGGRGSAACGSPWQSGAAAPAQSPVRTPLQARARAPPATPPPCATTGRPVCSAARSPSHHVRLDECAAGGSHAKFGAVPRRKRVNGLMSGVTDDISRFARHEAPRRSTRRPSSSRSTAAGSIGFRV